MCVYVRIDVLLLYVFTFFFFFSLHDIIFSVRGSLTYAPSTRRRRAGRYPEGFSAVSVRTTSRTNVYAHIYTIDYSHVCLTGRVCLRTGSTTHASVLVIIRPSLPEPGLPDGATSVYRRVCVRRAHDNILRVVHAKRNGRATQWLPFLCFFLFFRISPPPLPPLPPSGPSGYNIHRDRLRYERIVQ